MPKHVWFVGFEFRRIDRRSNVNRENDDNEEPEDRSKFNLDDNAPINFGATVVKKIFKIK